VTAAAADGPLDPLGLESVCSSKMLVSTAADEHRSCSEPAPRQEQAETPTTPGLQLLTQPIPDQFLYQRTRHHIRAPAFSHRATSCDCWRKRKPGMHSFSCHITLNNDYHYPCSSIGFVPRTQTLNNSKYNIYNRKVVKIKTI